MPTIDHGPALKHLCKADPILATLIEKHGECLIQPAKQLFPALVHTIIHQQISTKAAAAISKRVEDRFGKLSPEVLHTAKDEHIQSCGLSGPKRKSLRGLTTAIVNGELDLKRLKKADEQAVKDMLLPLHGFGPWSVDMVLMFALGRPDILPVGDYGFRVAVKKAYKLRELPKPKRMEKIAEPWRPYRSAATWYLWRSLG